MEEKRQVYLDYSATTPVKQEVVDEMIPYFTEKFGNASAIYSTGAEAKELALSLIEEGSSVSWGGSVTIREIGLTEAVNNGNYRAIDRIMRFFIPANTWHEKKGLKSPMSE